MSTKLILKILLIVFLLVPSGLALWLLSLAKSTDKRAGIVSNLDGNFAKSGLFVAEGTLRSPSGEDLKSMHFEQACLAFRIKFDLRHTVTDSEGEQEDKSLELFEERHQVKDLEVVFGTGKALLDIQVLESFYEPKVEVLDDLPEYVPYERIPKVKTENFWFEVYETLYLEGQKVTVLGQLNQLGLLEPTPEVGELIVFPGTTAEFLEAEASSSRSLRLIAYVLMAVSLVVCGVLGLVLKFLQK